MYKISDEIKVYRKDHEKLHSETDSRRKKLSCWKHSEKILVSRCGITINISDGDDATESYAKEMHTYLSTPPLGQDMTQGQFLSGV